MGKKNLLLPAWNLIQNFPLESFTRKQEYGLTILVSSDDKVNTFLKSVLSQIKDWLEARQVHKLVVVLANVETKETLERWEFNVEYETDDNKENTTGNFRDKTDKDEKKIRQEIREVIRQITASVTFLPLLDCICSFDVLIYTEKYVFFFCGALGVLYF